MRSVDKAGLFGGVPLFPDAQENLRNFDRDEREERERKHDEVLVPLEIYQLEEVHDAGHEYRQHNPAYPRFLKAENIKEAELAADEAAAEAFDAPSSSEEHPDEAEGIYLGDAFEGKMDALEEKAATDLEAYIKGKGGE